MTVMQTPVTDRAAWLEERRKGIGASEAAAVLGRSPFEGPLDVYLRKIGALDDQRETEAMELGTLLEPVLAELYQRRTGLRITGQQLFVRDEVDPFLFATLDGVDEDGSLVEFKTVGTWARTELGEEGTDALPEHWILQAHQQMHVAGRDRCEFAVLIGGQEFRRFTVKMEPRIILAILPKLREFWGRVQRLEPPDSVVTPTARQLAALNPECSGEITIDNEIAHLVETYEQLGDQLKLLGDEREGIRDKVLAAMGTAQLGRLPDGQAVKRFLQRVEERVQIVKPHSKHFFRVVKARGE